MTGCSALDCSFSELSSISVTNCNGNDNDIFLRNSVPPTITVGATISSNNGNGRNGTMATSGGGHTATNSN